MANDDLFPLVASAASNLSHVNGSPLSASIASPPTEFAVPSFLNSYAPTLLRTKEGDHTESL
jgi:hypothetical protein